MLALGFTKTTETLEITKSMKETQRQCGQNCFGQL